MATKRVKIDVPSKKGSLSRTEVKQAKAVFRECFPDCEIRYMGVKCDIDENGVKCRNFVIRGGDEK